MLLYSDSEEEGENAGDFLPDIEKKAQIYYNRSMSHQRNIPMFEMGFTLPDQRFT